MPCLGGVLESNLESKTSRYCRKILSKPVFGGMHAEETGETGVLLTVGIAVGGMGCSHVDGVVVEAADCRPHNAEDTLALRAGMEGNIECLLAS